MCSLEILRSYLVTMSRSSSECPLKCFSLLLLSNFTPICAAWVLPLSRVLLGLYFSPRLLYSLLKQALEHERGEKVVFYVFAPDDAVRQQIVRTIASCAGSHPAMRKRGIDGGVKFVDGNELESMQFDYIEYMEGMSRNSQYMSDLVFLQKVRESAKRYIIVLPIGSLF
jgi:hypothetical protein